MRRLVSMEEQSAAVEDWPVGSGTHSHGRRVARAGTSGGCELPPAAAVWPKQPSRQWGCSTGTGGKSPAGSSRGIDAFPEASEAQCGALCGAGPSASHMKGCPVALLFSAVQRWGKDPAVKV